MSLVDLWVTSKEQILAKNVQQLIAFTGEGRLKDGSASQEEFQAFLSMIDSDRLVSYGIQCLESAFQDSGFALQDIVNEIGRRLGFKVSNGRYRGNKNDIGFDGLWGLDSGHSIVIEVKTTDAYRIDLNTIADYRRDLIKTDQVSEEASSVLMVVGRQDTGDLEAQIRGSRYAWNMRLISYDALVGLMKLREEVDDPVTVKRIHEILIPREYTRLDEIITVLFSTAEDLRVPEPSDEMIVGEQEITAKPPVSFHAACVSRIEAHLGISLLKKSRTMYHSSDNKTRVTCAVSKEYPKGTQSFYWFAFHPYQKDFLQEARRGFVSFGLGTADHVVSIPASEFIERLDLMNITEKEGKFYWHIHIRMVDGQTILALKQGFDDVDISQFIIPA